MATTKEKLEVADSEDEPLSSSPVDPAGEDADKLPSTANVPLQAIQDALPQAVHCHQAFADHTAKESVEHISDIHDDQGSALVDVNSPGHHVTSLKPTKATPAACTIAEVKDTDAQDSTTEDTMQTMREGLDVLTSTTEPAPPFVETCEQEYDSVPETTRERLPRPDTNTEENHEAQTHGQEMQFAIEQHLIENRSSQTHSEQQQVPVESSNRSTTMGLKTDDGSQSSSISHSTVSELSSPMPVRPVPMKSAQEQTLAELRAQRTAILASLATLPAVQVLIEENALTDADDEDAETQDQDEGPSEKDIMFAANKLVKEHIKLLHEYNELKDVGQGLMGLIADQRGVRIVEVQEEFGIDAKD